MEQVCAERALEKSPYIAVRNIRGMDVIHLQRFVHIAQHFIIVLLSAVDGRLVVESITIARERARGVKGILLRTHRTVRHKAFLF